jgi:hypothetical protein
VTAAPHFGLSTFLARVIEALGEVMPDAVVHHIHRGIGIDHTLRRVVEQLELPEGPVDAHEPVLVVDALGQRAVERPVVIVVDDVEDLDGWSTRLLQALSSWSPGRTSLVLGTHREPEAIGVSVELEATYDLGPFDRDETERLIGELGPDLSADARLRMADRIHGWCLGDPVATQAAIELVAEHGESAALPLRSDDAERIESQLGALDESSRDLLTNAAVLGPTIDCLLLADLTGASTESIVGRIGLAVAAGLVKRSSKPGCWEFADLQTREALARRTDELTSCRLHLAAAEVLLARRERGSESAFHLLNALPLGDVTTAALAAVAAGLDQLREHRYETAALLYRSAAGLLADPAASVEARLGEALALERLGDHDRADEIYQSIVDDPAADNTLLARAALGGASRASRVGGQPRRRRRLGVAHRRLDEDDVHADEVVAELALEQLNGAVPFTPGITDRLVEIADRETSAGRLLALRMMLVLREIDEGPDLDGARHLARLALSEDTAAPSHGVGAALAVACHLVLAAGAWGEAESLIDEFDLHGRRTGDPRSRWQALAFRAAISEARGSHATADGLAGEARALGARLGLADADAAYGLHYLARAFRAGSLATFTGVLGGIDERYQTPVWHAIRGLAELDAGAPRTAQRLLHSARQELESRRDVLRAPAIALTCLLAARLGRTPDVAILRQDLDHRSNDFLFLGYGGPFLGPIDWFRAEVSQAAHDVERAVQFEEAARGTCRRAGASFEMFAPGD